jgi:ribosomal protein S18 acetylase RimI-like enzyme
LIINAQEIHATNILIMTIKSFHDFETAEIFAIIRHIYITSEFMSDNFDRKFRNLMQFRDYYAGILKKAGSFMMVAMYEDKPVGFLVLEANPAERLQHTARLNMGIIDRYRRKGFGIQLVEAAIERSRSEAITEIIYLMVRADHLAAIQLYKKTGFEIIARLEKDTKIGHEYYDGLMMRLFVQR